VAEAAIALRDVALAKCLLSEASEGFRASPHAALMQGRIAFSEGDFDRAKAQYGHAASELPSHRPELLFELAAKLLEAKKSDDAIAVFREIGV
jgi:TolA-binding protein